MGSNPAAGTVVVVPLGFVISVRLARHAGPSVVTEEWWGVRFANWRSFVHPGAELAMWSVVLFPGLSSCRLCCGALCLAQGIWRNGSAPDSRSEGREFESLCPDFRTNLAAAQYQCSAVALDVGFAPFGVHPVRLLP